MRERHRGGGLWAARGVQGLRGRVRVRQGRRGGHVAVPNAGDGGHAGDQHQRADGVAGRERDTGGRATTARHRVRIGRIRRFRCAVDAGLGSGGFRVRVLVLLSRRRYRQIVVEKNGRIVVVFVRAKRRSGEAEKQQNRPAARTTAQDEKTFHWFQRCAGQFGLRTERK